MIHFINLTTNINSRIGSNNKEIDSVTADLNTSENIDLSIKQTELESKRKKFEQMPAYLKAGLYYTTKLECVRNPNVGYF